MNSSRATLCVLLSLFSVFSLHAQPDLDCLDFLAVTQDPLCPEDENGTIILTVDGDIDGIFQVTWSDGGTGTTDNNVHTRTGMAAGTYSVTLTVGLLTACEGDTILTLNDPSTMKLTADASAKTCFNSADGSIDLTVENGTPPYTFLWNNGAAPTEDQINNLFFTSYSVTVTDANNCTQSLLDINVPSPPPIEVGFDAEDVSCIGAADGSITMQMAGGVPPFSHSWSDGATGAVRTGLSPGVYVDTILDAQLCPTNITFITIGEPEALSVEVATQNITCNGDDDGVIAVAVSGGTFPYSIEWADDNNSFERNGLSPGNYVATVTDVNGCEAETISVTLTEPPPVVIDSASVTGVACAGASDGVILLFASGGSSDLIYNWSNGNLGQTQVLLQSGNYIVTVTDGDGCTTTGDFEVPEPDSLFVSCTATEADKSEEADTGEANLFISGGTPPFSVLWQGRNTLFANNADGVPAGDFLIENLPSDTFDITVTDQAGCEIECTVFIEQIYVVSGPDLFIVEFEEDANAAEIEAFEEYLDSLGADRKRACHCLEDSLFRVQLWRTDDIIEINTSTQGDRSKTKMDTSGLGRSIFPVVDTILLPPVDACVNLPGQSVPNKRAVVAIIDSGVDNPSRLNPNGHPALGGLEWTHPTEVPDNNRDDDKNCCSDDLVGFDYLKGSNVVEDQVGHGTHIAGIIADRYPDSIDLQIINLRIFGNEDPAGLNTGVFDLTCAIHYAISQEAQVINLSLGYYNDRLSKPLYRALKRAEQAGIPVIISAGNDGVNLQDTLNRWPGNFKRMNQLGEEIFARLNNVLIVSSLDSLEESLDIESSNYGRQFVDLATRADFFSTHLNGEYKALRGTSMAAAHLSRAVSIIRAHDKTLSPERIFTCITDNTEDIKFGDFLESGGKLNLPAALTCLGLKDIAFTKGEYIELKREDFSLKSTSQFKNIESVDYRIQILDGQTPVENVGFKVHPLGQPGNIVFDGVYCSATGIRWQGEDNNGGKVPGGTVYEYILMQGAQVIPPPFPNQIIIGN